MYYIVQIQHQDIFASYTNLESQVLPDMGFADRWEQERNGLKEFVAYNPSMTDLRFHSLGDINVISCHFCIERDAEGGITTIVEVLENGMYFSGGFMSWEVLTLCKVGDYLDLGFTSRT